VKYTVIELNLYLMVHSIILKFEKIWLSSTLIILYGNQKCDGRTDERIPIYRRHSSSGGMEVKGQGPIKVITVRDTPPYGHAPTYQI
jgi:hypothetical protein